MNEIYLLSPIIILLLACIIFAYSKFKMKNPSLHEQERGLEPIYSMICTVYFDRKRYTFTRFAIYDEFVVISNHNKILLKFDEIKDVSKGKPFFGSTKLTINHKKVNVPSMSLILKDVDTPKQIIQNKLDHRGINRSPVQKIVKE